MSRLPERPGERISRGRTISFSFDGKRVQALEGDTIASALYAAGRRTFSRSFKYHRPRGLLCCAGQCPNCLVQVGDAPGVRACTEPVREGMEVTHMNASPSLDFDAMRVVDLAGSRLTPPGFYYKTFIRPRRLWPLYEKVLRHAAGLGRLRRRQEERESVTEYRRRHADVLVVGGGEAGLTAAIEAAEGGADVVLCDDGPDPGGRLLAEGGHERARELAARARAAGVEVLENAPALGYFDGLVPVWRGSTLHQVRAREVIFATGAIEQPLVFAGNDLPGVMLAGGVRRLLELYAVRPGTRAVVVTAGDRGWETARALFEAGVAVAAVADLRGSDESISAAAETLRAAAVPVLEHHTVVVAKGRRHVRAAVLAPVGGGTERTVDCDLLVVSGGEAPATGLVAQAGATTRYDRELGAFVLDTVPDGVRAVGAVAAGAAGERAPAAHGYDERGPATHDHEEPVAAAHDLVAAGQRGKCFACFCEDVTAKDLRIAVAEGYDSIELAKRYTTATMGPCQGRMCQLNTARLLSDETGQSLADVGTTTARPPWTPVPLGALAGRPFQPAKRSSIHGRHRALGANVRWAADWRRVYDYGDPEAEALSVHERAGLIDVSTLGKLLVRGADSGEFLDRMYPNRLSNLAPGRVRYGVLTSDAGRILDDGTIARLDEDTFYVTTTSSGAGAVEQLFLWWLADWDLDVRITDVTQGLAAVNLAGPNARTILRAVSDVPALEYLDARQARVAGITCLLLRIGFVGELGYELHFPAALGEPLWDALIAAGEPHGLKPFGLEAQRLLRAQKQHIIVGQDTDSESTPYGAAMPWIVKLDKPQDFVGRWALEHAAGEPPAAALVGFEMADGHVPAEGSVVLPDGQVTSAYRSPQLGRVIGLAWVPAAHAEDGRTITISDGGRRYTATVATKPFYDPEGKVLRG